ncbi:uncharacterized protein LOC130447576 isoform X3 [Diorhabda sublineata]|uniref:uncharacterized protein LOC130447576 isoform X3 n=1 Tax=Diorhabda sublineata TaxID=1163346 RepID=UPI0024E0580C|nr:uncharacterized protein LOC130447576 isoform X3 [Diorhabda sublineata]
MEIQNVKEEIEIYDDFLSNIDVKQEPNDEVSTLKIENINEQLYGIYSIKQEVNNDLNTAKIFDNNVDEASKTERNILSIHIVRNKLGYLKVHHGKRTKLKDRQDLDN